MGKPRSGTARVNGEVCLLERIVFAECRIEGGATARIGNYSLFAIRQKRPTTDYLTFKPPCTAIHKLFAFISSGFQ